MEERVKNSYSMVMLVGEMVRSLVDDPCAVQVDGKDEEGFVLVSVRVAPADVGKVIGRQGRTARSLRTIVAAAGMTSRVRCELNIEGYREGR